MADFAIHLNQSSSNGEGGPSLFDVVAANSLSVSLKPAYEHCLRVFRLQYPAVDQFFDRFQNGIYYVCLGAIEWNHLAHHSASFAEYFYGLERTTDSGHPLSRGAKVCSLLELLFVPALEERLADFYLSLKEKAVVGELDCQHTLRRKLERAFYKTYPYLHFLWKMYRVVLYFRYCFRLTNRPSALFQLLKLKYQYMKPDISTSADPSVTMPPSTSANVMSMAGRVFNGMTSAVPFSVFFVKFLEWWYAQDTDLQRGFTSLPIPPPPMLIQSDARSALCDAPSRCPICQKEQKAPSLLSTSGVLYCYACIHRFVSQSGCCFLTRLPSSLGDIIRVYID